MKTRLWICKKCGTVYRRYKKEERIPLHCGQRMAAARKYPYKLVERKQNFWERQHRKKIKLEKKYSRTYNSEGRIFHPGKKTKKLWRKIELLKYKPALINWGNKFLVSMRKDLGPYGIGGVPVIKFEQHWGSLGTYRRSLLHGEFAISLEKDRGVVEIKHTFLHEVLHWIDDQADGTRRFGRLPSDHFAYDARLKDLAKRLNAKFLF